MKNIIILSLSFLSLKAIAMPKVIYGIDDRFENRKSPFSKFNSSIAIMVANKNLKKSTATNRYSIKAIKDLRTYQGQKTCEDTRFRDQADIGDCTGFLIDDQTLVTAGHCLVNYNQHIRNSRNINCANNQWIFEYEDTDYTFGQISFREEDVYGCDKVIEAKYTETEDYAIIKLNKETSKRQNLTTSTHESNYEIDSNVFTIGHPHGLPLKIAGGASVRANNSTTEFITNLDTFAGNSGSPIFNDYGEVIGILVSGEIDYIFDTKRKCYTPNTCLDYNKTCTKSEGQNSSGESATKIAIIENILKKFKN